MGPQPEPLSLPLPPSPSAGIAPPSYPDPDLSPLRSTPADPPPALPSPPKAGRHHRLPATVLVDRSVGFVDQLQAFIQQELGWPSPEEAIKLALDNCNSIHERNMAVRKAVARYQEQVEEPAFRMLRDRRKATGGGAAVRKEPLAFLPSGCDAAEFGEEDDFDREEAAYFRDMLEGTEPFVSQVAHAPGVTSVSLNIAWPPEHPHTTKPNTAFITGCHRSLLLLSLGNCSHGNHGAPGFYMVYDTQANSVAIVPRLMHLSIAMVPCFMPVASWSHCHIARRPRGAAVLCLNTTKKHTAGYLLAELLLRIDQQSYLPTNKATLFLWESLSMAGMWQGSAAAKWIPKKVVLPLPLRKDHISFQADMAFAVGPTSLCWVDLITGILLYNHTAPDDKQFHFIPLPSGMHTTSNLEDTWPEEYRSMCCINHETLKYVSMEGFNQEGIAMADVKLTTWILKNPRSRTKSRWLHPESVRIGDLWHNPLYNDLPLLPRFPVISTTRAHVVYLSVINFRDSPKYQGLVEATELYVLGIDMLRQGVVSAFRAPSEYGAVPLLSLFTSHFTRYLNQTTGDLYKGTRGKELGESRSDPAAWTSLWISKVEESVMEDTDRFKEFAGGNEGTRGGMGRRGKEGRKLKESRREEISPNVLLHVTGRLPRGRFARRNSKIRPSVSSISPVVGLQCVLDETEN